LELKYFEDPFKNEITEAEEMAMKFGGQEAY
jgi:hypothetical protein